MWHARNKNNLPPGHIYKAPHIEKDREIVWDLYDEDGAPDIVEVWTYERDGEEIKVVIAKQHGYSTYDPTEILEILGFCLSQVYG
jgi:hypothetical protein